MEGSGAEHLPLPPPALSTLAEDTGVPGSRMVQAAQALRVQRRVEGVDGSGGSNGRLQIHTT